MDVSSRGSLDTACTSAISPDLMLRRWAFLAELDSPPPANPPEITWISLEAIGAELLSVEAVVVAAKPEPGSEPDFKVNFQVL